MACEAGHGEVVETLIENGADVNAMNEVFQADVYVIIVSILVGVLVQAHALTTRMLRSRLDSSCVF